MTNTYIVTINLMCEYEPYNSMKYIFSSLQKTNTENEAIKQSLNHLINNGHVQNIFYVFSGVINILDISKIRNICQNLHEKLTTDNSEEFFQQVLNENLDDLVIIFSYFKNEYYVKIDKII